DPLHHAAAVLQRAKLLSGDRRAMVDRRGTAQSRASALRRASRTRRHRETVGPASARPPDDHDADQWVDARRADPAREDLLGPVVDYGSALAGVIDHVFECDTAVALTSGGASAGDCDSPGAGRRTQKTAAHAFD